LDEERMEGDEWSELLFVRDQTLNKNNDALSNLHADELPNNMPVLDNGYHGAV
jgi:hypothetical protein